MIAAPSPEISRAKVLVELAAQGAPSPAQIVRFGTEPPSICRIISAGWPPAAQRPEGICAYERTSERTCDRPDGSITNAATPSLGIKPSLGIRPPASDKGSVL